MQNDFQVVYSLVQRFGDESAFAQMAYAKIFQSGNFPTAEMVPVHVPEYNGAIRDGIEAILRLHPDYALFQESKLSEAKAVQTLSLLSRFDDDVKLLVVHFLQTHSESITPSNRSPVVTDTEKILAYCPTEFIPQLLPLLGELLDLKISVFQLYMFLQDKKTNPERIERFLQELKTRLMNGEVSEEKRTLMRMRDAFSS